MFFIKDTAYFSHAHKRPYNQDRCFYMTCDGTPDLRGKISILCVLDGVSNSNGGDAAPMAARVMRGVLSGLLGKCDALLDYDDATREEEIFRVVKDAVFAADLCLRQHQYPGYELGTTATVAVVFDDVVYAANVGDSPAYLLRWDKLSSSIKKELTIPLFQCQTEAGMDMEPYRPNALVNMIGGEGVDSGRVKIHTTTAWLGSSDILLLGSDGALSVLPPDDLAELMDRSVRHGLSAALEALYQQVQDTPTATDNATVLAHWVESY